MPVFFVLRLHNAHRLSGGKEAGHKVLAGLNAQMAMQRYMNCGRQSRSRVPIYILGDLL
jgi:hypothetical protein